MNVFTLMLLTAFHVTCDAFFSRVPADDTTDTKNDGDVRTVNTSEGEKLCLKAFLSQQCRVLT